MLFYAGSGLNEISTVSPLLLTVNGSERMRITSGGQVGIGTTSVTPPNGINLEVANSTVARVLVNQTGTRCFSISAESNAFYLYDQTAGATRLYVNSGGNIGIGTTSPTSPLHVAGGGGNGTAQFAGTNYTSHINYGSNEDTYIRGGKTAGSVYIADVNSGNVYIANGGGNVGIGTTAPSYRSEEHTS